MFRLTNRLFSILAITILLAWPMHDLDARGARGGGFGGRSFSSSRTSRPSFPSSSSSRSSTKWGVSRSSRDNYSTSRSDSTLTSKVNRGGTTQSRGEAVDTRRSPSTSGTDINRSPSRSTTTTSTSPSRTFIPGKIPEGMRLPNGQYAPVYRDQSRGGYGFWDSVGNWVLLSAIMNSANRSAYQPYYPPNTEAGAPAANPQGTAIPAPGYQGGYDAPRRQSSSGIGSVLAVIGLIVIAVLVSAGMYMHRSGSNLRPRPLDARFTPPSRRGPVPPPMPGSGSSPLDQWLHLPPGSFVTLTDQQALEDSQKRGTGLHGIDYKVESIGVVKDIEGLATWVLAHLDDGHQKLLLMVKGDETHIDHRVYYASEDFRPAKRENVVNRGDTWLFEPPAEGQPVRPANLRYTAEIPYSIGGQELLYVRKEHGERHGDYTERPGFAGLGAQVATVVEYLTTDPTDNPELLVLEIATANQKTGEISVYLGCPIRASEANIVKAA